MRLEKGDYLSVFNAQGEWSAIIENYEKEGARIKILKKVRDRDNEKNIWLAFSLIKQNPLNFIIQKGTELGVQKFIPILSERTIVKEINIMRIKKIIVEASEQSNRISVPEINNLETLKFFLSKFPKDGYLLFCDVNCEKNNLKKISNGGERNYFAQIENLPNSKIIYLHAKEIIQRLGDGTIDIGISGLDLLQESSINLQNKIEIKKKLDFGVADVVVAIPNDWIDVQTVADLEEVSFDLRDKKNTRLRVATKYPNLTNNFLVSKGITQYKLVPSLGATETYPFIGSSEIITDITSTGKTLKDNNLRVLKDGCILNSQACLLISKKKAATLRPFLNSLI